MEFCNGGELSKALDKYQQKYGKPFSQEIVQHLMQQIIDAFRYIHSQNIIHRGISLDNILLNFETEKDKEDLNMMKATVKIIDFGFACYIKSGLLYSIVGNPLNMDPMILKQLFSKTKKTKQLGYDKKADVWSLGSICYEMLIGKPVFDAESLKDLVEIIEQGKFSIPTDLSKETISFINGMLQYESNKRLTCEELSKHPFLINKVEDFHQIDNLKCVDKSNHHKSIWSIFNSEDEIKLMSINGKDYNKNEEHNNGLQLPTKGIPGNPIDQKIQYSGEDTITPGFCGGIFDDKIFQ
jgi:serine/threonine protein kinase